MTRRHSGEKKKKAKPKRQSRVMIAIGDEDSDDEEVLDDEDKHYTHQSQSGQDVEVNFFLRNKIFPKIKFLNDQDDINSLAKGSIGLAMCKHFEIKEHDRRRFWKHWREKVSTKINQMRNASTNYMRDKFLGEYKLCR